MKEVIKEVLTVDDKAFQVPMKFYETVQEADTAAGKEGACLAECNLNLAYRGTYADAREMIVDIVNEKSGVPFIQVDTGEKDDKGKPILERDMKNDSDAKYVRRVFALGKLSFDDVQAEVTKRSRGWEYKDAAGNVVKVPALAVDIRATERKPTGPKKLAQKFKNAALEFITGKPCPGFVNGRNIGKFLTACKAQMGVEYVAPDTKVPTAPANIEALGWVIKKWEDFRAEQQRLAREAEQAKQFGN